MKKKTSKTTLSTSINKNHYKWKRSIQITNNYEGAKPETQRTPSNTSATLLTVHRYLRGSTGRKTCRYFARLFAAAAAAATTATNSEPTLPFANNTRAHYRIQCFFFLSNFVVLLTMIPFVTGQDRRGLLVRYFCAIFWAHSIISVGFY